MGQASTPSSTISAEVILRSKTGRSLAAPDVAVRAANVKEFMPAPETVAKAKRELEKLGFAVSQTGVTLTLTGEPERFERVLGVRLSFKRHSQTGQSIVHCEGEVVIPESLRDVVETIVFPEPPEFFP